MAVPSIFTNLKAKTMSDKIKDLPELKESYNYVLKNIFKSQTLEHLDGCLRMVKALANSYKDQPNAHLVLAKLEGAIDLRRNQVINFNLKPAKK